MEDRMTESGLYESEVVRQVEATQRAGFDYEESRLSEAEIEVVRGKGGESAKIVMSYERGILTGGEFDCLVKNGCQPWDVK